MVWEFKSFDTFEDKCFRWKIIFLLWNQFQQYTHKILLFIIYYCLRCIQNTCTHIDIFYSETFSKYWTRSVAKILSSIWRCPNYSGGLDCSLLPKKCHLFGGVFYSELVSVRECITVGNVHSFNSCNS